MYQKYSKPQEWRRKTNARPQVSQSEEKKNGGERRIERRTSPTLKENHTLVALTAHTHRAPKNKPLDHTPADQRSFSKPLRL